MLLVLGLAFGSLPVPAQPSIAIVPSEEGCSGSVRVGALAGACAALADAPACACCNPASLARFRVPDRSFPLLDWSIGPDGLFDFVKFLGENVDTRESFHQEEKRLKQYHVWTRTDYTSYRTDGKKVVEIDGPHPNPLGIVPIVTVRNPEGSMLSDAAYLNRGIFNWSSLLDEILYRQTFAQLVLPGEELDEVKLGTATALNHDPEAKNMPAYIAPPNGPAEILMKQIEAGAETVRAMILFKAQRDGLVAESGISKAYDFVQLNHTLVSAGLFSESRLFPGPPASWHASGRTVLRLPRTSRSRRRVG